VAAGDLALGRGTRCGAPVIVEPVAAASDRPTKLVDRSADPSAKMHAKSVSDQGCYWWAILDLNQ
jgi:hypothetical protein